MPPSRRAPTAAAGLLFVLAACAACGAGQVPAGAPAASQPAGSTSAAASTPPPSATAAPAAPADERTAKEVLSDLSRQVDEASLVKTYTEEDDPNKLLGRPNGYTSKVAFADSRIDQDEADDSQVEKDAIERGGSVEVYPDEAGAKARADYIQTLLKGGGLGSEYDYVRGGVLVRVTGDLTPKQAKDYQAAVG